MARRTRSGLDGKVSPFASDSRQCNGQAFGPDGRLYAVSLAHDQVVAYDSDGHPTLIAAGLGRNYNLVVRHDGRIYTTSGDGGGAPASSGPSAPRARNGSRMAYPDSPAASRSRPTNRCST